MGHELYVLLGMVICGAALSLLFDFLRGMRAALRPNDLLVIITDFLFWTVCAAAVAWALWTFNSGDLRLYEFVGLASGSVIYFMTVSRFVVRGVECITKQIFKIFKIIFNFLLTPARFLYKIISSIHINRLNKKSEDKNHE